ESLQRVAVKRMLADWERQYPGRSESIFSSLRNVVPSHLADAALHDFAAVR
ncbi:MAG TPA: tRNA 2-thiocytidine(32) synthetase TtcA, partial [Gammaproteobacteria bacterium]|nr:tRNA 2-thiocytidine(32) synthetase TtcA [Gammaproteobacteria bacterium]